MKRLLNSVGLWYAASFIPMLLLIMWWGWRKQRVVKIATPRECSTACAPIYLENGRFVLLGIVGGRIRSYYAETLELEWKSWRAPTEIRAVFSGSDDRKRGCYHKATVVVRGMLEDCLGWQRRISALLKAKEDAQKPAPENPKAA